MIEAEIECLITEYTIEDLGLLLKQGQVVYRPESQARSSSELKIAQGAGAVSVRWVERSRVSKPPRPLPPSIRMSRPNKGGKGGKPSHLGNGGSGGDPSRLDHRPIVNNANTKAVADAATNAAREAVREETASVHQENAELKSELAEIKGLLQHLVANGGAATQSGSAPTARQTVKKKESDEPMYIPKGIVDSKAKTDLNIKAEEGTSSSLDATAAALKAAKGPSTRKRRTKKKTEETD